VNHNEQLDLEIHTRLESLAERLKNDQLTADELATLSRQFLADAQRPNPHLAGGYDLKLRFTLQAQFFQGEAARKRAEQAAEEDRTRETRRFWLDFLVIGGLILVEIVIAAIALSEGRQQAQVLSDMKTSTAATATAMTQATAQLQRLADEQKRAADRLKEMSDNIQASTGATRNQLRILKQEQTDTIALRSRKPILRLIAGGLSAPPGKPLQVETDNPTETSATLTLAVTNDGNVAAHGPLIRLVIFDEKVYVDGAPNITAIPRPFPNMASAIVFTIGIERLAPRGMQILPLTFHFPPGHSTFRAEELEAGTPLAQLTIVPRPK
jgi:hypothetical protein